MIFLTVKLVFSLNVSRAYCITEHLFI